MRSEASKRLKEPQANEALAFLQQAEDFYRAASSGVSTNPVLTYYALVNLAKALIRLRGYSGSFDRAMHGLTEATAPGGTELVDSQVVAKDSGTALNIYPELIARLGYIRPAHACLSTYRASATNCGRASDLARVASRSY